MIVFVGHPDNDQSVSLAWMHNHPTPQTGARTWGITLLESLALAVAQHPTHRAGDHALLIGANHAHLHRGAGCGGRFLREGRRGVRSAGSSVLGGRFGVGVLGLSFQVVHGQTLPDLIMGENPSNRTRDHALFVGANDADRRANGRRRYDRLGRRVARRVQFDTQKTELLADAGPNRRRE